MFSLDKLNKAQGVLFILKIFSLSISEFKTFRFLEVILQSTYVHLTFQEPDKFTNKVIFSPIQGSISGSPDYAAIVSSDTSSFKDEK
jgi:hypothetical protein